MQATNQLIKRLEAIKAFKIRANQLEAIDDLRNELKATESSFREWLEDNRYRNRHDSYLAIDVKLRSKKAFQLDVDEAEELGLSEFNTDSYWWDWIEQNQSYIKDILSIGKNGLHMCFEKDGKEYKHIAILISSLDNDVYFLGSSGGWLCIDKVYYTFDRYLDDFSDSLYDSYVYTTRKDVSDYCDQLISAIAYCTKIQEAFEWLKSYMEEYIAGMDFSEELKYRADS